MMPAENVIQSIVVIAVVLVALYAMFGLKAGKRALADSLRAADALEGLRVEVLAGDDPSVLLGFVYTDIEEEEGAAGPAPHAGVVLTPENARKLARLVRLAACRGPTLAAARRNFRDDIAGRLR